MNEDIKEVALLPCPFCGSSATLEPHGSMNFVSCDSCGIEGPTTGTTSSAIEAWNRRAELQKDVDPVATAFIGRGGVSLRYYRGGVLEKLAGTGAYIADLPLYAHPQPKAPALPEGWKLVPVEPTQEMVRAAYAKQPGVINGSFSAAYSDMLEVAPALPAQFEGEQK